MSVQITDNDRKVTELILVDLSNHPKSQIVVYCTMVASYLIILAGDSPIIGMVRVDGQLHTSMYFFLSNLSFLDI